jgi:hypothetical protein
MAPVRNFYIGAKIDKINLGSPYVLWKKYSINDQLVVAQILGPVFSFLDLW